MMSRKKRKSSRKTFAPEQELKRAEEALDAARDEQQRALEIARWRRRLQDGWDRVRERNNLAGLFTEDYGRTR